MGDRPSHHQEVNVINERCCSTAVFSLEDTTKVLEADACAKGTATRTHKKGSTRWATEPKEKTKKDRTEDDAEGNREGGREHTASSDTETPTSTTKKRWAAKTQ